jgi:hydroxymethylbilane synthase
LGEDFMVPAVGQGALAIETREDDEEVSEVVRELNHEATRLACKAEREFLKGLGGGCLVPIGGHAEIDSGTLRLIGLVIKPDGSEAVRGERHGAIDDPESLGQKLAEELLIRGARRILTGD